MAGDGRADALDERGQVRRLGQRRQAEVALGDRQLGEVRERAEDLDAAVALHRVAELPLVPRAAHAVEHHAREPHGRVELDLPPDERRDAPAEPLRADDEHDGQAEQRRQGRPAVRAGGVRAVVEPVVRLDEREVGAGGAPRGRPARCARAPS